MRFDHVEEIFMERDFLDRTVLNIITDNNIKPFIVLNKLRFLLDKIWDGKESDLIDGKTSHFSQTKYLLNHQIKRLRGITVSINDIIGSNFRPNIEDYNFIYQIKFRTQSVVLIFQKDFVCATVIVFMFQYINYSYLGLFTSKVYQNAATYNEQIAIILVNMEQYKRLNFVGTILSVSYFLNILCRLIYNHFSKKRIRYDIWLLFDFLSGTVNILAFNIVGNSSPESILNPQTKRFYDYYMIVVLIVSWLRFFSYFLVIRNVSKITLTLFMMLKEAMNFMLILACYFIIMTTVFATLFKDADTDDAQQYHEFFSTMRALIDYFLANFSVKDLGTYTATHDIMYIIHVTISNIFLLNFLVAILQTVFDIMIKDGDFYTINYQYIFITKYMKAMDEENGYDKLILYPPPLNFLLTPLILLSPWRPAVKKVSYIISYLTFWIENILLVICFFLYMMAHDPMIIVKIYFQIFTKIDGIFTKFKYIITWALFGWIYLLYVNMLDTIQLLNILCLENSIIFDQGEEERTQGEQLTFFIKRNIIRSIKILQEIGMQNSILFDQQQTVKRLQTSKMTFQHKQFKDKKNKHEMKNQDIFIVKKDLIIAVYEQISSTDKVIQRHRYQQYQLNPPSVLSPDIKIQNAEPVIEIKVIPVVKMMDNNEELDDYDFTKQEIPMVVDLNLDKDEAHIGPIMRNILGRIMLSKNRVNIDEIVQFVLAEKEKTRCYLMTDEEAEQLNLFLSKFAVIQPNQETLTIDLDIVVKSFPKVINNITMKKIDLLNFNQMQQVLISFFNDDQDEMFTYFDGRMNGRLEQLKEQTTLNNGNMARILEITKNVYNFISIKERLGNFYTQNVNKVPKNEQVKVNSNYLDMVQKQNIQQMLQNNIVISAPVLGNKESVVSSKEEPSPIYQQPKIITQQSNAFLEKGQQLDSEQLRISEKQKDLFQKHQAHTTFPETPTKYQEDEPELQTRDNQIQEAERMNNNNMRIVEISSCSSSNSGQMGQDIDRFFRKEQKKTSKQMKFYLNKNNIAEQSKRSKQSHEVEEIKQDNSTLHAMTLSENIPTNQSLKQSQPRFSIHKTSVSDNKVSNSIRYLDPGQHLMTSNTQFQSKSESSETTFILPPSANYLCSEFQAQRRERSADDSYASESKENNENSDFSTYTRQKRDNTQINAQDFSKNINNMLTINRGNTEKKSESANKKINNSITEKKNSKRQQPAREGLTKVIEKDSQNSFYTDIDQDGMHN